MDIVVPILFIKKIVSFTFYKLILTTNFPNPEIQWREKEKIYMGTCHSKNPKQKVYNIWIKNILSFRDK